MAHISGNSTEKPSESNRLRQQFQLETRNIRNNDRGLRKNALKSLYSAFIAMDLNCDIVLKFFLEDLEEPLISISAGDSLEKCRELALSLLHIFTEAASKFHTKIADACMVRVSSDFIDVCSQRIGVIPFPEASEEIRTNLLDTFLIIVKDIRCAEQLNTGLGKVITIASRSLTDASPQVKQRTAALVGEVSRNMTLKPFIHLYMTQLLNPLLENILHQRAKVRQKTISALCAVINACTTSGDLQELEKIVRNKALPLMKKCCYDNSSVVRKTLYEQVSFLASSIPINIYEPDLLLILLSGISDQAKEIQYFVLNLIESIAQKNSCDSEDGESFESENFCENLIFQEPFLKRPSKTSRMLFDRRKNEILSFILQQCQDWTTEGRIRGLLQLQSFLVFVENRIVTRLGEIINVLVHSLMDDDDEVVSFAESCVKLVDQYMRRSDILFYLEPLSSDPSKPGSIKMHQLLRDTKDK
mmetsp:Transcript_1803/g.2569  ORF Transcript_1803/g.2569 Transcript_1803/m.2569 type:complete len:473 (+) Transcript_1803:175-1593(+)